MRIEIGKGYTNEDAIAAFGAVIRRDHELDVAVVIDAETRDNGIVDEKGMTAAAVMAGVDWLKTLGMPLDHILVIVTQAYEEGGNDEPVRTRV